VLSDHHCVTWRHALVEIENMKGSSIKTTLDSDIHVWHTVLNDHSRYYKLFQSWLSEEEKTRIAKFKPLYRQRFILSHGILRDLLSRYSGQPPEKIQFSYTERGKPIFINQGFNKQIEFNLSHSKERIALAFTHDTPIGIDLEYKIQRKYIDKVAYRFFPAHDYEQLKYLNNEEKLTAFFNAWASNEAVVKALGNHLQTHPLSQYKNLNPQSITTKKEKDPYTVLILALHPAVAAALAIKGKNNKLILIKKYVK
jgi:4'-phosphopantetheinyl transferase